MSDHAKSSIYLQKFPNFLVSLFHILESKYENLDPTFSFFLVFVNKRNKNAKSSKERKENCF